MCAWYLPGQAQRWCRLETFMQNVLQLAAELNVSVVNVRIVSAGVRDINCNTSTQSHLKLCDLCET